MIYMLRGPIIHRDNLLLVISAQGVGYGVTVPLSTYERVASQTGDISLFVHTDVREDAIQLYGFVTEREKQLFLLLRSVSGIGPKIAINILSRMACDDIVTAIQSENDAALTKTPGVGEKTAKRIIVELKDKLKHEVVLGAPGGGGIVGNQDALQALITLGYPLKVAESVINKLPKDLSLENQIKEALKALSKG